LAQAEAVQVLQALARTLLEQLVVTVAQVVAVAVVAEQMAHQVLVAMELFIFTTKE
jgi:hypothetical protein